MTLSAGDLLKDARSRHGLTQAQLAIRAMTDQSHVSRIERGEVSPSFATLTALLQCMGESLDVRTHRMPGWLDDDPHQRATIRRMSIDHRLETTIELSELVSELAGPGRKRP